MGKGLKERLGFFRAEPETRILGQVLFRQWFQKQELGIREGETRMEVKPVCGYVIKIAVVHNKRSTGNASQNFALEVQEAEYLWTGS